MHGQLSRLLYYIDPQYSSTYISKKFHIIDEIANSPSLFTHASTPQASTFVLALQRLKSTAVMSYTVHPAITGHTGVGEVQKQLKQ